MRKNVIYSCPFVPPEWIEAHGWLPSRVIPHLAGKSHASSLGVCSYAQSFINLCVVADDAAAVVVTTACDQMRRASEVILRDSDLPVFVMNIPHTWQTPAAYKLYMSELKRFGNFLVGIGGTVPTQDYLVEVMSRFDTQRFNNQEDEIFISPNPSSIPIALIGGPLPVDCHGITDMIKELGGYIALDGTENGERTLPAHFDRRRLREDPLGTLADAYFGSIPDPFRRPNSEFYRWLKYKITERGVRGIVLRRYVWCDNWHAEAERIKEWAGLPFLQIDVGDDGDDSARVRTRLQAFMEMLK